MAISDTLQKIQKNFQETKPPMGEMASSDELLYLSGKIIPYNPDTLIGRKGFHMYDQMRIDDQVKACLTLKKFATLAPNFEIISASNDEQDLEVADFVTYCFEKMQGSMMDYLLEIMTALDYGYSITEINYKQFETGPHAGKIGLKNLKTKAPYYYKFAVDEYSNLLDKGIVYDKGGKEQYYPINKFLIFSYQKEFGNHYGTSDLRPAYRGYWSKDVLIKMWNIYLERFANPTVVGKYKSNDATGRTNLRNILDNLTSKTSITHRMDEFDIQLLESTRASTNDFNTALNFYNKCIARSILIPDRLMAEGDTGAYAQAKIHFDVFLWVIEKLRQDIEENVMNEQLLKRLIAYNFSNVEELPRFKFNPLTDDQKAELNTMFIHAVEKGVIVPTLDDENILRKQLNFPEKDLQPESADTEIAETPDEEVIEEVTEQSQQHKHYALTKAEKRVNFKKIDETLVKLDDKLVINMREVMNRQMEAVKNYTKNKMDTNKFDFTAIDNLDLKYKSDFIKVMEQGYIDAYDEGKKEGKSTLPKRFLKTKIGTGILTSGFQRYFKSKARLDVKKITALLNTRLSSALIDSIVKGKGIPKTALAIEKVFQPFIADGTEISAATGAATNAYTTTTIARTATLGAYNYGRREVGDDKDLKGFILGYQLSAVLDDRTSEICELVGELMPTIKIEDEMTLNELTPPLHFNCRTMLVFITKDDTPIEWSSDGDLEEIIALTGITE
ncbi:MAG: putative portal protein [Prokaryotic dsDNA virus sp.]|nr:MAG: putative portal protein [Prokaryotic dsDNA virus sp.]|tara:strand:- start:16345 stop:18531 length:2187 start_codon:yes stop_codon:yes gene_type:complete